MNHSYTSRDDIWTAHEPWRGGLLASVVIHGFFFSLMIASGAFNFSRGQNWGGASSGGEAINANLVSSIAVPLPRRDVTAENVLATESTGLTVSQPKAPEPEPEPEAVEIPAKPTPKITAPPRTPTNEKPRVQPPPTNEVPFGEGGPTRQTYSVFQANTGSGGVAIQGGGDFGSRFAWYVDGIRRVVSQNWYRYEVDPRIGQGRKVYVSFDILRNGEPTNVRVAQSSGVPTLDVSARRALERIDTFGPLPPDYRGDRVSVEFYFEYRKQ